MRCALEGSAAAFGREAEADVNSRQMLFPHFFFRTYLILILVYQYINQTGDEPQKQDTQANKRTPLLREEVPYQITLIRLRQWQGSLDRRRREKVIRKMFTEDDCNPLRTWKVRGLRADRRNVVMDEVAHDVS